MPVAFPWAHRTFAIPNKPNILGRAKAFIVLDLVNTDNKEATNVKLSVTTESDYVLDCEQYEVERIPAPVEASSTRILVKLGTVRVTEHKAVRCSASKSPCVPRPRPFFIYLESGLLLWRLASLRRKCE
jgi:hypothetical protein